MVKATGDKRSTNLQTPLSSAKQLVKQGIEQQRQQLIAMTAAFCKQQLDDEYAELCEKMISKMARKRSVPFLSGRVESWAAATVYALCQINFGFDRDQAVHTNADTICNYFGVSKGNVGSKAKDIREMFKLDRWNNEEFATTYMRENNPWKNAESMLRELGLGPRAREMMPGDEDDLPMSVTNEEMMEVLGLSEADMDALVTYSPEAGNIINLSDEQHMMLMAYIRQRNAEMKEHIAFATHEEIQEVLGLSEADIAQMTTYAPELGSEAILLSPEQLKTLREYMAQKQKKAN